MRAVRHLISLMLVSGATALLLGACGAGGGATAPATGSAGTTAAQTSSNPAAAETNSSLSGTGTATAVSEQASTALITLYAAETGALATYRGVVSRLGGIGPFPKILEAEKQHAATVAKLAAEHGVTLPAAATGEASPATLRLACRLGVTVEHGIVSSYEQNLPYLSAFPATFRALETLQTAAEENHLPALQNCS